MRTIIFKKKYMRTMVDSEKNKVMSIIKKLQLLLNKVTKMLTPHFHTLKATHNIKPTN